jgi:hypothetical protein
MPPIFFLTKGNCNNNEIYIDDSYIFCNYEAFFHKVFIIFSKPLPMLSMMLYTCIVKFPALTPKHIMKTLFQFIVTCKMHHVVHLLQGQTGGSQRVPDLGCEQDWKHQSITFFGIALCVCKQA